LLLLFFSFVQCLAWDVAKAANLRGEVIQAQADAVMVRERDAQVEKTVWENATLLEASHDKETEADQKGFRLMG
jgi:hypothetical protein